jgi:hypothetical protein
MKAEKDTSRRLKNGLTRQWMQCKECGVVLHHDYVAYGLGNPTVIAKCLCGSRCLNHDEGRSHFRNISAAQARVVLKLFKENRLWEVGSYNKLIKKLKAELADHKRGLREILAQIPA